MEAVDYEDTEQGDTAEPNEETENHSAEQSGSFEQPEGEEQYGQSRQVENHSEEVKPKFNKICPSVLKGEPCWALSRGKPCHYAKHDRPGETGGEVRQAEPIFPQLSSNVYVCHLPFSMTKEQLQAMFSPYGNIRECKLLVEPKTQESKGVGFVHFSTPLEAKNSIDGIHGLVITGSDKALECRLAKASGSSGPSFRGRGPPPRGRGGPPRGGPPPHGGPPRGGGPYRGPPRGPPREDDYGRGPYGRPGYEDDYPPRGYGEYARRPPYDEYDYGPIRRGPPGGPRPSPYARPEPRRGPPRGLYEGDDFDPYGPPRRGREGYDPYLEAEYLPGGPPPRGGGGPRESDLPFSPREGGPPFGSREGGPPFGLRDGGPPFAREDGPPFGGPPRGGGPSRGGGAPRENHDGFGDPVFDAER